MTNTLMMGAVAYDPKVVTIWEGFRAWFADKGLDFDYVLYSNYEQQVRGHFAGQYDVAWNSPLAWLQAERVASKLGRKAEAIAMRDTDMDLKSVIVGQGRWPDPQARRSPREEDRCRSRRLPPGHSDSA